MLRLHTVAALSLITACSALVDPDPGELGGPGSGMDSGTGMEDAGPPPGEDAGPGIGEDAGPGGIDAGDGVDAGPGTDAGTPIDPGTGRVTCADMTCNGAAGEICCIAVSGGGDRSVARCIDEAGGERCACEGFFCETYEIACDGPEDCPGTQRCCALKRLTEEVAEQLVCAPACENTLLTQSFEVCHQRRGEDTCLDPSHRCREDDRVPPGYRICVPP